MTTNTPPRYEKEIIANTTTKQLRPRRRSQLVLGEIGVSPKTTALLEENKRAIELAEKSMRKSFFRR
ncbi:MAG: hypothetical protein ABS939_12365 [Psychrobacillus sp.]